MPFDCDEGDVGATTVNIAGGKVSGKIVLDNTGTVPEAGYQVRVNITGGEFLNSNLDQNDISKAYFFIEVSGGTFDKKVPIKMCALDYICQKKSGSSTLYEVIRSPHCRVYLENVSGSNLFKVGDEVHFDGKPYVIQEGLVVLLDTTQAKKKDMFVTTYTIKGSGDSAYPDKMYVWYAKGTDSNNDGICDSYAIERVSALDNFFQYNGTSIRVGSATNGIRFFSSIKTTTAEKIIDGTLITSGSLKGAKMTGAGTVFKKNVTYVNLENGVSSYVFGGKVGSTFRVFQQSGGRNWFTGVLTGLDTDGKTINDPIATRPYAEIKVGGKTIALYGGPLERSIYYVAKQNQNTFTAGSTYDNFVENLIKKGDAAKGK